MVNVGDRVKYIFRDSQCEVISAKEEPHKYRFGVRDIDDLESIKPVAEGFDYSVVELGHDFSSYIDVREGELRKL